MTTAGTMSKEIIKLINEYNYNLDYVVRYDMMDIYQKYMRTALMVLKVKEIMKWDDNETVSIKVQDSTGELLEVFESYKNKAIDVGDIIVTLGGKYTFDVAKGEHLYLPKGIFVIKKGNYDLSKFGYMEEVSISEVISNYKQIKTSQGTKERLYCKLKYIEEN